MELKTGDGACNWDLLLYVEGTAAGAQLDGGGHLSAAPCRDIREALSR